MTKDVTATTAINKLEDLRTIMDCLTNAGDIKEIGETLIKLDEIDVFEIIDHIDHCLQRYAIERDHIREYLLKPKNISENSVKLEWSLGHFDGPVSGIASVKHPVLAQKDWKKSSDSGDLYSFAETPCYFSAIGNIHSRYSRIYLLYVLDSEEFAQELKCREKKSKLQINREKYTKRRPLGYFVR